MDVNTYDRELIDRAKHRGRAYLCLACHYTKKLRYVDEHGKMEDHILRNHIEADRIPFFCSLVQVPEEGPVCAALVSLRQARVDGGGPKDRGPFSMDGREYKSIPGWRHGHGQAVPRRKLEVLP